MKTLYVLRHAKSSWDDSSLSDFERPLNGRGKKTAPFMGELMSSKNFVPEVIICSPAERAKQTAFLVKQAAHFDAEIQFENGIYESGTHNLLYIVSGINDEYDSAMIVGHNPGFEGIVETLCGDYERMPTAALAVIDLDIESWSDAKPNCGNLREILRPKEQIL
jgi:phosphohistidine phosphatase